MTQAEGTVVEDFNAHPFGASGRPDNAYYIRQCDVYNGSPSYAACLSKLANIYGNKLCHTSAKNGSCQAAVMRKEELTKKVALYYIPRAVLQEQYASLEGVPTKQRSKFTEPAPVAAIRTAPTAAPVPAKPSMFDTTSFADVINAEMKAAHVPMLADESVTDYAKRKLALNRSATI